MKGATDDSSWLWHEGIRWSRDVVFLKGQPRLAITWYYCKKNKLGSLNIVLRTSTNWHIENCKYNLIVLTPCEMRGCFAVLLSCVAVLWRALAYSKSIHRHTWPLCRYYVRWVIAVEIMSARKRHGAKCFLLFCCKFRINLIKISQEFGRIDLLYCPSWNSDTR